MGRDNKIDTLIETGTYLGDMVFANLSNFSRIFSIELDKKLFERAQKRFVKIKKVKIFHGDSSEILKRLSKKIDKKILFWLDAHYSGGITAKGNESTPIEKELEVILNSWKKGSVIIIDDARLFNGTGGYPKAEKIIKLVSTKKLKTEISKDMFLIK
jgi:predicted O-methyltransferase YrrM